MTVGPRDTGSESPDAAARDAAAALADESSLAIGAPDDLAAESDDGADGERVVASPPIPRSPLLAGILTLLVVLAFGAFGLQPKAVVVAFAACVLSVLAAIDIEHRILPNRIVLPAFAIVLLAQLAIEPDRALEWLLAGPAAAAFLAAPLIVRRDAMGWGDVKLALLLGAAVGWKAFLAIVLGCFAMLPFAVAMLVRDRSVKGATLPFGPFLAFGTILILFVS
jgi:leader peptidase (prepilin peptidase)/N-methyltransferase